MYFSHFYFGAHPPPKSNDKFQITPFILFQYPLCFIGELSLNTRKYSFHISIAWKVSSEKYTEMFSEVGNNQRKLFSFRDSNKFDLILKAEIGWILANMSKILILTKCLEINKNFLRIFLVYLCVIGFLTDIQGPGIWSIESYVTTVYSAHYLF